MWGCISPGIKPALNIFLQLLRRTKIYGRVWSFISLPCLTQLSDLCRYFVLHTQGCFPFIFPGYHHTEILSYPCNLSCRSPAPTDSCSCAGICSVLHIRFLFSLKGERFLEIYFCRTQVMEGPSTPQDSGLSMTFPCVPQHGTTHRTTQSTLRTDCT